METIYNSIWLLMNSPNRIILTARDSPEKRQPSAAVFASLVLAAT